MQQWILKKKCSSTSIIYWMLFMLQTLSLNFTYTSLNTHNNLNRQVLLFPSTMRNWNCVCVCMCVCVCVSHSVVSNSLLPRGLEPTRLLCPWDSLGKKGCFKRTASKHVYYLGWNRSPAQFGCMRQALRPGVLGRPWGIVWRGRWEGGSGWGTHVNPWLFHFNVWQNPLQ